MHTNRIARDEDYAAGVIGVAKSTLRHWRSAGIGPRYVKYGTGRGARVVYFDSDLDDFIEEHAVAPQAREGAA